MTDATDHDLDHDGGLMRDLGTLAERSAQRRALLKWGLSLGALPLLGCAANRLNDASSAADGAGGAASTDTTAEGCSRIPTETAGPFPGDGTNGQNALTLSGIERADIRSSVGDATGTADGVLLTVTLTILDGKNGCAPLAGRAVYIWHCDRDGNYSMYSAAAANENYLRGVQETDDNGQVTFTTIFPGCYSGRWPHIHFEVYESLAAATSGNSKIAVSQLAMPQDVCSEAYATKGYESSVTNLSHITLATDNVFSDGADLETPKVTGSADTSYAASLDVAI